MKQESRFTAELFALLSPFVDKEKPYYLMLDGAAAASNTGAGKTFTSGILPDLWMSMKGSQSSAPLLLESKCIRRGRVLLMQSQLSSFRSGAKDTYPPQAWVGVCLLYTSDAADE